jgi:hypothetical protein
MPIFHVVLSSPGHDFTNLQIISSPLKLSEHWWKVERSDGYHEGWFRLNNLSLSKLGSFDKLIWVQRLDLSNNKLQSLEGQSRV